MKFRVINTRTGEDMTHETNWMVDTEGKLRREAYKGTDSAYNHRVIFRQHPKLD